MPGSGWITFDPTNRSIDNFNLIHVAAGHDFGQIIPVAESLSGIGNALLEVPVEVEVTP